MQDRIDSIFPPKNC